ncbi:MAG TPA: tRNA (guanosine(37)-N1)-methyltransferase TrmD [Tissierellia bacterium]|nr:tRNA (guanosine(37)-N1)-methyltransferase TrmD [Tissierellia bacterium]
MRIRILTLFPALMEHYFLEGIPRRAVEEGHLEIVVENIRDYSTNKHRKADDYPYAEGAGMVLLAQPLFDALRHDSGHVIHLSPRGHLLTQKKVQELAEHEEITLICSHYEGLDQRVIDKWVDEEISIGDYVLSGGELAALVLIDALMRCLPGVIAEESLEEESHVAGLLEYHHYTRPEEFEGMKVPEILLSGHHQHIRDYRLEEQVRLTLQRRPDMIAKGLQEGVYPEKVIKLIRKLSKEDIS